MVRCFRCSGQAARIDLSHRFADGPPTPLATARVALAEVHVCLQPSGGADPDGDAATGEGWTFGGRRRLNAYLVGAKADLWGKLGAIADGGTQGCPEAGLGISPSGVGPIRE